MKILIIEDDETLAREIASFLMRWGYETKIPEGFDSIMEEFSLLRRVLLVQPDSAGVQGSGSLHQQPGR